MPEGGLLASLRRSRPASEEDRCSPALFTASLPLSAPLPSDLPAGRTAGGGEGAGTGQGRGGALANPFLPVCTDCAPRKA